MKKEKRKKRSADLLIWNSDLAIETRHYFCSVALFAIRKKHTLGRRQQPLDLGDEGGREVCKPLDQDPFGLVSRGVNEDEVDC